MRIKINDAQMLPTFDYTVTLLNRLKAQHSATKQDVWKKTVLHNCSWSSNVIRNVQGSTVSVGGSYICRIPKDSKYRPYSEWQDGMEGFTFSTGDYVIKGEIAEDVVTSNDAVKVLSKYRPNAFEIKFFKDNTGTVEVAEHYRVEGV